MVAYRSGDTRREVLHDVSLHIAAQQVYGLVGESGSGKSTVALAAMRYLPPNGVVTGGQIRLGGENLLDKSIGDMRAIWGARMSLIPQDPGGSLNPAMRIGAQLAEIGRRSGLSHTAANERGMEWLRKVRMPDVARIAQLYPHQLSGGQQQRVMIAMALSSAPQLLILDEPTTNLDVTTEAAMLDLFRALIGEHGTAALYVTHNLGVVAQLCDRVLVLYAGEVMEDASVADLFAHPTHPYTLTLLNAVPRLNQPPRHTARQVSHGPRVAGCPFTARCPFAIDKCATTKPPIEAMADGHLIKCHRWPEIASGQLTMPRAPITAPPTARSTTDGSESADLLTLRDLNKHYLVGVPLLSRLRGGMSKTVKAVDDVTLTIERGQTIGLVGESGSGKTTLARCVVGLIERDSGSLQLMNVELSKAIGGRSPDLLRRVQMVFQNPEESLNPYATIGETLRRPLITLQHVSSAEADRKVLDMLRAVQLGDDYAARLPSELSGGEKQRVAIARAFITDPDLVVCDEAVSALDVSVQAAILDLLTMLKDEQHTSYLFISHDLAVIASIADVVAVMYLGELMEIVPRPQLLNAPLHPYTEALLSAVPIPDPNAHPRVIRLESDTPSPTDLPSGCRFHTRCPRRIGAICETTEPPIREVGDGHWYRCHIPVPDLTALQADTIAALASAAPPTR